MTSVAIAHPSDIWSAGVATVLRSDGYTIVGRWPYQGDLLPVFEANPPDVLIVSKGILPEQAPEFLSKPFSDRFSGGVILVLEDSDSFQPEDFVTFDVEGLILSTASTQSVLDCVRSVADGRKWIDPDIRRLLGNAMRPSRGWSGLSAREQEVARLASMGLSNKKIARALHLSDGTVKMHMHHILSKLRVGSRVELVRTAARSELMPTVEDSLAEVD